MIFLFKKKEIVLDCFTANEGVITTAPIVHAIKNTPKWWQDLPPYRMVKDVMYPTHTAKYCTGIVDYFAKSIVIPLWSDLMIKVNDAGSYNWQFADMESTAVVHNTASQATGFMPTYGHIKLQTPWKFKTKEEISWVWSHPVYNFPNNNALVSLPAVVNYKWQATTSINMLISLDKPQDFFLKHGQSLIHITPMSDRKVKIVRHLVSKEEYERIGTASRISTFYNNYNTRKELAQKFSDCPFKKG